MGWQALLICSLLASTFRGAHSLLESHPTATRRETVRSLFMASAYSSACAPPALAMKSSAILQPQRSYSHYDNLCTLNTNMLLKSLSVSASAPATDTFAVVMASRVGAAVGLWGQVGRLANWNLVTLATLGDELVCAVHA